MTSPRIEEVERPVIGEKYLVPHVFGHSCPRDVMFGNEEPIPIIGTWHNDREDPIKFGPYHYHLDFRFVSEDMWRRFLDFIERRRVKMCLNAIVAGDCNIMSNDTRLVESVMLRDMTQWDGRQWFYDDLQLKYHGKCRKNGICPHKGNPTMGLDTCPAHGLRFNGDLVAPPRRLPSDG